MPSKYDTHELESLLHEVRENGYTFINKYKLWRLLGKGSAAAGTWKALLDMWEEVNLDNKRSNIYAFEVGIEYLLTIYQTDALEKWANER